MSLSPHPSPPGVMPVDALVIGGGLQGLLVMDRLSSAGFSCVLVSASDLGAGQTLHSHGVLNTGFGMAGPEPIRILRDVALPDLARRGIRTYGEWGAISPASPPAGETVPAPAGVEMRGGVFLRLPEVNIDKRELVSALARGLEDRILGGRVAGVERAADGSVRTVDVAPAGGSPLRFVPGAVIVAAGTGAKALLRRLGAGEGQREDLKHRRVHVLCVRGRSSVLPILNFVSPADSLFVAAHERDGVVTWYATPMLFDAPHIEDVPGDASAEVDQAFAERGWDVLFRRFPPLKSLPGLSFATYAGFRQDIGDQPGAPKCEQIESAPNVIAALPSGLLGAWPVAVRTAKLVSEITTEKRPQPVIPAAAMVVRVGDTYEDAGRIEWSANASSARPA